MIPRQTIQMLFCSGFFRFENGPRVAEVLRKCRVEFRGRVRWFSGGRFHYVWQDTAISYRATIRNRFRAAIRMAAPQPAQS